MNHTLKAVLLSLLLLCLPALAFGHGSGFEPLDQETVAIRFGYGLGAPIADAEVQVLPPGSQIPHQVGRTDSKGAFAFVPDQPGEWTLIADDGAGHRVEARATVTADGIDMEAPQNLAIPPIWLLIGLLLSLLINAGLISALLASRKK